MAYADYKDLIVLTEELFRTIAQDVLGNPVVKYGDRNSISANRLPNSP